MNRVNIWRVLLLFAISGTNNRAEALRCYACTYVAGQTSNTECIDRPDEVEGQKIVDCTKRYCTILRQELKDPAGRVQSFQRGCEDQPQFLNDVIEDSTFKTYYRSCTSDLCNSGTGTQAGGGLNPDGSGNHPNIAVPGLPNQATTQKHQFGCITGILIAFWWQMSN